MITLKARQLYLTEGRQMRDFDLKRSLPENVTFEAYHIEPALPPGLSVSPQGIISGTPTQGCSMDAPYDVMIDINDEAYRLPLMFRVGVQMSPEEIRARQSEIWQAIATDADLPDDFLALLERPISKLDIYHLIERYASFVVWNAEDRRLATTGTKIKLRHVSDKFQIYDFGVCLVASPKDLFATDRSLGDALDTARGMVKEAHRRRWQVEFGGFDKMAVAAWQTTQDLNAQSRHKMQVKNYTPPPAMALTQAPEEYAEPE